MSHRYSPKYRLPATQQNFQSQVLGENLRRESREHSGTVGRGPCSSSSPSSAHRQLGPLSHLRQVFLVWEKGSGSYSPVAQYWEACKEKKILQFRGRRRDSKLLVYGDGGGWGWGGGAGSTRQEANWQLPVKLWGEERNLKGVDQCASPHEVREGAERHLAGNQSRCRE